jgi:SAM-dependent methyltransferase
VDLVVDFHALHHIEDWRAAVRECARILRPGGQLALAEMTRRFVDARWLRAVSRHPADRFDTDELLAELRGAGFEVPPGAVARRAGDRWVQAVVRRA